MPARRLQFAGAGVLVPFVQERVDRVGGGQPSTDLAEAAAGMQCVANPSR